MKKKLIALSVLMAAFSGMAADISVEDNSKILIGDDISGSLRIFGAKYSYASTFSAPARNDSEFEPKSGKISGKWKLPNGETGTVDLNWKNTENGGKELNYKVSFPNPVPVAELNLTFQIPIDFAGKTVKFGGKKLYFPKEQPEDPTIAMMQERKKVEIPLEDGILTIEMKQPITVIFIDNRKWKSNTYSIRMLFPVKKTLTTSQLDLRIGMKAKPVQEK